MLRFDMETLENEVFNSAQECNEYQEVIRKLQDALNQQDVHEAEDAVVLIERITAELLSTIGILTR